MESARIRTQRTLEWAQRVEWGLLLALALAIVAAMPFLTRPGLPRATDAELHVYRAAELGHTLREGELYPRWAPDLYLGYGYPIFNYYAPLTYYLANAADLLPGFDIVSGVKVVFVAGLLLASTGAYLLGRSMFGRTAGVLAAASYVFAPYIVFIDPHVRGDLAEHFAVCLLPLVFYTFDLVVTGRRTRWALLSSVSLLGALVLSHNLTALVGAGLLGAYWLWGLIAAPARRCEAGWGALVFTLAAGLVAFFWLPALAEWDAVNLVVTGPGHFDFRQHFVALTDLLAPSRILDLGATAPRFRFNLGLAQWVLAAPGAIWFVARRGSKLMAYFSAMGLLLCLLITSASRPLWEAIPPMAYLQFPWRLLGPANLMLAVAAAGSVAFLQARVGGQRERIALTTGGLALVLALALLVLYPPMWLPDFGSTSSLDIIEWEIESLAFGTTSTGDFVPKGAALVPMGPTESLLASYAGGGPVDRVNRATLPEGARVEVASHRQLRQVYEVSSETGFILRLYTFYFPGWRATIDGEPAEIAVADPEGFITVRVPAGEHTVGVRFGDTPPRTAGWAVSGVALASLVAALVRLRPSRRRPAPESQGAQPPVVDVICLGSVLLLFVLVKSWVVDPHDDWLRQTSPPGQVLDAGFLAGADFGGQIELIGYDMPSEPVKAGDTISVVLYWRALRPLDDNYQSFVHLTQPESVLWGQEDHLNPGGMPTTRWPMEQYVWDEYQVRVQPGTPPGEYVLSAGLYLLYDNYRLPLLDASGQASSDRFVLGTIHVVRSRHPPRVAELDMAQMLDVSFEVSGVTLVGTTQSAERFSLGDGPLTLTLFWRADEAHPAASARSVSLVAADGAAVWCAQGAPGGYSFQDWASGEVVRDLLLVSPEDLSALPGGEYRLRVMVVRTGEGASQSVDVGRVWLEWSESDGGNAQAASGSLQCP
ncbi:MAG: hypothetical protein GX601_13020 [Anaerolineales bacterium]|nr:hypothetical protein [Anaerolineales bacterium]